MDWIQSCSIFYPPQIDISSLCTSWYKIYDKYIASDDKKKYVDDDGSNIHVTPIDDVLLGKKGVEDVVIPNGEDIHDELIMDDDLHIYLIHLPPSKTKLWSLKKWTRKIREGEKRSGHRKRMSGQWCPIF